jgi:hypothetical protein
MRLAGFTAKPGQTERETTLRARGQHRQRLAGDELRFGPVATRVRTRSSIWSGLNPLVAVVEHELLKCLSFYLIFRFRPPVRKPDAERQDYLTGRRGL